MRLASLTRCRRGREYTLPWVDLIERSVGRTRIASGCCLDRQGCDDDERRECERSDRMTTDPGRGARGPFAGGGRRGLGHDREPVPGDRSRVGRGADAQVPRLCQRLAAGRLSLVAELSAAAERAGHLGAAVRPADRLDERLSPVGDAADCASVRSWWTASRKPIVAGW